MKNIIPPFGVNLIILSVLMFLLVTNTASSFHNFIIGLIGMHVYILCLHLWNFNDNK